MHNHVGPAEYPVTAHFSLVGVDPRLTTHSCLLLPSWLQLCEKFRVNTSHLQATQQIIVVYLKGVPQFAPLDNDMHPPHDSPHGI